MQRSLACIWHPCTQMKDHEWLPMVPIASAEGVWLTDTSGKRYLDGISSWWTNILGHRHPVIMARIKQQLDTLDHVIFAGFTHEPAVQLAEKLCELTQLDRCFFADNGSAAVEVALKMSAHYWRNVGQPAKTGFIALTNSYHGETLGALAVGDNALYREAYAPMLMQPRFVTSPDCFERAPGTSWEDHSRRAFAHMEMALEQHAATTAAVIVEPLVQCAGGMRMYHPVYLTMLREACNRHGVHLIVDEIATGFGRTGKMFAHQHYGVKPDIIAVAKGISSAYMPIAATVVKNNVFESFLGEASENRQVVQVNTYGGHPVAAAVAVRNIEILMEEKLADRSAEMGAYLMDGLRTLMRHPHVGEVRGKGLLVGVELVKDRVSKEPVSPAQVGAVVDFCKENGVLLGRSNGGRKYGGVITMSPPLVITRAECDRIVETLDRALSTIDFS